MTKNELNFALKIAERHKITVPKRELEIIPVKYVTTGNFTKALIWSSKGLHIGVAKRNPNDENIPARGKELALRDALQTKPILLR